MKLGVFMPTTRRQFADEFKSEDSPGANVLVARVFGSTCKLTCFP